MFKRKARRAATAVRIAIAIAPLAACDGSIESAAAKQAEFFSSGDSIQTKSVADFAITAQAASIEHHHFDVYTSIHAAFDNTPTPRLTDGFGVPANDRQSPGTSFDGSHLPDTIRTCSARTLLVLD